MSGDSAAADVMTGALAARVIEPRAGEAPGHHVQGMCLNCGTRLIGAHCHGCGQLGHVHRTAGAIGHELAHGVFHFEGKIWRTLPMLALRPGELTRRYVAGERARFVSPLALFLFSVFLMFAVVANLPAFGDSAAGDGIVSVNVDDARAKLAEERLKAQAVIKRLGDRLAAERRKAEPDAQQITELEQRLAQLRADEQRILGAQRFLPAPDGAASTPDKAESWLQTKYRHAMENPRLLLYKLKSSAYKYSWALIPLSLPFIWLLFPFRRDVGLYDHAIFATYSLSFMSLMVVVLGVLASIGVPPALVALAAMLVPPVHIYKQLKGAYGLSRAGGLWRTGWMLVFALVASIGFGVLLLTVNLSD